MTRNVRPVEVHTVLAAGERIEFRLVRMPRRRHAHLFVDAEHGVEVRASTTFSSAEARSFVAANGAWVQSRLAEIRRSRPPLVSGARLPLLDETLTLRVDTAAAQLSLLDPESASSRRRARLSSAVSRQGRQLVVDSDRAGLEAVRERIVAWYRDCAAALLPQRTQTLAAEVGLEPSRVRVKAQKSMWGSCSASGEISLNWRLVLVPARLADYVVVHELCHIAHHDHSPRFWSRVAQTVPDYRECRAELRARQNALPL